MVITELKYKKLWTSMSYLTNKIVFKTYSCPYLFIDFSESERRKKDTIDEDWGFFVEIDRE